MDRWCRLVRQVGGDCGRNDLRLPAPVRRSELVVLHPGAAAGSRRWPVARWAAVAAALGAAGRQVAVTGSAAETDLCAAVCAGYPGTSDLSGRLDVAGLAALVAGAGMLLSGDTGVAHLATAYGTPSVLLFGPTPPARWGPAIDPDRHQVLWHGTDLPGTEQWCGDPHAATVDPALALITVDEVVAAAERAPRAAHAGG